MIQHVLEDISNIEQFFFPAAIMKNTGMIVSNDVHAARVKALVGNFHRMGITNSLITNMDGRMFAKVGV